MFTASNIHYELATGPGPRPAASAPSCWPRTGLIDAIDPRSTSSSGICLTTSRTTSSTSPTTSWRRHASGRHRTAPQRRGVSRCPGRAAHSRSDHRRRFLPALSSGVTDLGRCWRCSTTRAPAGLDQQPARSFRRPSSMPTARMSEHGRVQAGHGHRLQRHLGLPSRWSISLANTGELLNLVNRSGNRPSHEGRPPPRSTGPSASVAGRLPTDPAPRRHRLHADQHLDRWDDAAACSSSSASTPRPTWTKLADDLPSRRLASAETPAALRGQDRSRGSGRRTSRSRSSGSASSRTSACVERGRGRVRLPPDRLPPELIGWSWCARTWRSEKGAADAVRRLSLLLLHHQRLRPRPAEIVFAANDRCNQENLLAQLKNGVHALTAPVDNLVSNWAYMVMAALAWNLKAGCACCCRERPAACGQASSRESDGVEDGVQDVRECASCGCPARSSAAAAG